MRIRALAAPAAAIALLLGAAPAAVAGSPAPWQEYRQRDFVVPAGEACSFAVESHVVADKERFRTVATYPNGDPKLQEFTGQLIIRFTNLASGESVVRNLTGRGDFHYGQDGSFTLEAHGGHIAGTLHPGDEPAPGIYVLAGHGWAITQDASGHRTLIPGHGTKENLCDTLAA